MNKNTGMKIGIARLGRGTTALLTAAILLLAAGGCAARFAEDVAAEELLEIMETAVAEPSDFRSADEAVYRLYFADGEDAGRVSDHAIAAHRETLDFRELGVLHARSAGDVPRVEELARAYLEERVACLREFARAYHPEGASDIENADVRVLGNYVVFYVLDAPSAGRALEAAQVRLAA